LAKLHDETLTVVFLAVLVIEILVVWLSGMALQNERATTSISSFTFDNQKAADFLRGLVTLSGLLREFPGSDKIYLSAAVMSL
jgi:hypothetical protein